MSFCPDFGDIRQTPVNFAAFLKKKYKSTPSSRYNRKSFFIHSVYFFLLPHPISPHSHRPLSFFNLIVT